MVTNKSLIYPNCNFILELRRLTSVAKHGPTSKTSTCQRLEEILSPDYTLNDRRQRRLDFIVISSECTSFYFVYAGVTEKLVSCLKCLLEIKLGCSARAARTFNGKAVTSPA